MMDIIQRLKNKVWIHIIHRQRMNLDRDPYYKELNLRMIDFMAKSATPMSYVYKNGGFENVSSPSLTVYKEMINHYVHEQYPSLSPATDIMTRDYMIECCTKVDTPERLPLNYIDHRFKLFKRYLDFHLNSDTYISFDEWLFIFDFDNLTTLYFL